MNKIISNMIPKSTNATSMKKYRNTWKPATVPAVLCMFAHQWLTCEVRGQGSVWGGCRRWASAALFGSSETGSSAPASARYSSGPAASSWSLTARTDTKSKHQDAVTRVQHKIGSVCVIHDLDYREVGQNTFNFSCGMIFIKPLEVGSRDYFGLISCIITPLLF